MVAAITCGFGAAGNGASLRYTKRNDKRPQADRGRFDYQMRLEWSEVFSKDYQLHYEVAIALLYCVPIALNQGTLLNLTVVSALTVTS